MMYSTVIALLCALGLASAQQQTAHVFLVIGQSNSVGTNGEGLTDEDTTNPRIVQTTCCHDGATDNDNCNIILAQDPLHHQCDTGYVNGKSVGFAMNFARKLIQEIPPTDYIILVPAAIGGTGFVDDVWTAYTGRGFTQALARLQYTFRILALDYPLVLATFEGILWHQGEADAGQDATNYLFNDLIPMVEAWRNTSLIPQSDAKVPFVAGDLLPSWLAETTTDNRVNISNSILILPQFLPFSATAPSQGLVRGAPDNIHFSAPSQRNFGNRYFASWRLAQTNAPIENV